MLKTKLTGMGVALITPFKEDETIDFDALANLLEFQVENGTDYLVVGGTTSEVATLSNSEKEAIKHFVVEKIVGRIPLVYGIGGNNTKDVVHKVQNTDLTGYSAILSVTPYYNKPSQEGLFQHYSAIAEASKLPIILYNVPG
ncbi:MAG: 4-hydroxy-tetrahydrodipicolinate synthase, partial [Paludibacter sp.]